MKVIVKEPSEAARFEEIDNTLEALQAAVGGYIETVTLAIDLIVICDEEGRLKDREINCDICGIYFVGTVLLAGKDGEEFCDVPMGEETARWLIPQIWEE